MKKKEILISLAVIAACAIALYIYLFPNTLVHGSIELKSGNTKAVMRLRTSLFGRLKLSSDDAPVQINARIIKPQLLNLSFTQNGNPIQLTCGGPWGDLSKATIKENEKLTLQVGPPFLIKPKVKKYPDQVTISFAIAGVSGEQYKIPRLPKVPKVNIVDENGKIINSGNFSYG